MFAGYNSKKRISERYKIVGFISSGTYGRVYKAVNKRNNPNIVPATHPSGRPIVAFAIKKYVPVSSFQAPR